MCFTPSLINTCCDLVHEGDSLRGSPGVQISAAIGRCSTQSLAVAMVGSALHKCCCLCSHSMLCRCQRQGMGRLQPNVIRQLCRPRPAPRLEMRLDVLLTAVEQKQSVRTEASRLHR